MAEDKDFQTWLDQKFPLPRNKMARVRVLAKELAEGAGEGFWKPEVVWSSFRLGSPEIRAYFADAEAAFGDSDVANTHPMVPLYALQRRYLRARWGSPPLDKFVEYRLLFTRGYLKETRDSAEFQSSMFDLVDQTEPSNVFISYKRSESSAFALLVLARLKEIGLHPFVDMAIEPGANWKEYLREKIESSDFIVVLLGTKTLESTMTQQEIIWARQMGKIVIPVWHNGFQYRASDWKLLPEIDDVLSNTHTIIVQNESAGGYNAALTELMNRFGFTP